MKLMATVAAVALLAATSFAYADGNKADNLAFVTQIGDKNQQITIQTADPSWGKDHDPLNVAVTTQFGKDNGSFTLQDADHHVTNAAFTFQAGTDNKSVIIQGGRK